MSALTRFADSSRTSRDVREVPNSDMVGLSITSSALASKRRWHVEAQRFRGIQIDDKLDVPRQQLIKTIQKREEPRALSAERARASRNETR